MSALPLLRPKMLPRSSARSRGNPCRSYATLDELCWGNFPCRIRRFEDAALPERIILIVIDYPSYVLVYPTAQSLANVHVNETGEDRRPQGRKGLHICARR